MRLLFNKQFLLHNVNCAFEGAYRVKNFSDVEDTCFDGEEFLSLIHSEKYIDKIRHACNNNTQLAEIRLNKDSWKAAMLSIGLTVLASEQNDFAVVRPPGHHAGIHKAEGFCLFNNIAIAAQRLVNQGKKVFIFDFDAHHGNGTQEIFYKSNKVFYSSIHQIYTYPMTGWAEENGEGEGKGFTLNIPLVPGSGDKDFWNVFEKIIMAAIDFKPDIVGVSAGFDGYRKDKMLSLNYSLKLFYEIGFKLKRTFSNVFGTLEGGYHEFTRTCVDHFVEGVNKGGRPPKIKWNEDMAIG